MSQPDHRPIRTAFIERATALLLGPLEDREEIGSAPVDTYLTGILWPQGETLDAIEDDEDDGSPSGMDGDADGGVPGYRAVKPCSLGLTFAAHREAAIAVTTARTARYVAVEREAGEGGRSRRIWCRQQLDYLHRIAPGDAGTWRIHDYTAADGTTVHDPAVEMHIRRRIAGDLQVLTVTLVNRTRQTEDRLRDELCLLQAGLRIDAVAKEGTGAIVPRPAVPPASPDEDMQSAALLYRDILEYAVGHGIAVSWTPDPSRRVTVLETSWMPRAEVKGMSASGHESLEDYLATHPGTLSASWLARADARTSIIAALCGFADVYGSWIEERLTARLDGFAGDLHAAAQRNRDRCVDVLRRIRDGIALLEKDEVWTAFVLANEAMDRQSRFDGKGDRKRPLVWRPFQLAYILMVIPGLAEPDNGDRDFVDLLWFPTGGGKTEAYLGLAAFEIFFRRLTDAGRRSRGGVDVLMRYTLRLLTVQQFQRAASLVTACDIIRQEREDLGTAPISIGLYVGGDATPNRTAGALAALDAERQGQRPRSTPRQLLECPVCGEDLDIRCYSAREDGIDVSCANNACATSGRPLPVVTVDDFLYAEPPSLLIGTVDKFAQLPRRDDLRSLFALDGGKRPGLIIQDELHLISGPLGSMTGLYETVVDMLCTDNGVKPKVIGSTATIGQAARQVRALFDRPVMQFPPSGFEADDSFFAVRDATGPDRIYLGLCSAGRSPKFALQAAAAAFLQTGGQLVEDGTGAALVDPYWTAVLYFNSLRELGGAHVLMQDDIPRQMAFLAGRLGGPPRPLEAEAIELSSRVASRDLPDHLAQLGIPLADDGDPFAPLPRDAVLASNMISVGVDVPRLGFMIVNGQPKSTAEYIQASSRVGRGLDGLVLTLYNFGRPRDVSHFEHFLSYHGALYRSVEATSVTPWAPRARDKALHAVVAAAVRHLVSGMDDDEAALGFDASTQEVKAILASVAARAMSASEGVEGQDALLDIEAISQQWSRRSNDARIAGNALLYWERKAPFGKTRPHLMTAAEEGARPGGLAWPTPNSMREVEPSTAFALKSFGKN